MPAITVLSYNLWFHKAFGELAQLVGEHTVDVLCLQECKIAGLDREIGGLNLVRADLLHEQIGLALFVRGERWQAGKVECCSLPDTAYERASGKIGRTRLQLLELTNRTDKRKVVIGNVHVANLLAGKRARRSQAVAAAEHTLDFAADVPTILAGDFNFPFGQTGLLRAMEASGFSSVTQDSLPTYRRWPRRTFDRMFTTNIIKAECVILPFGASDHAPIAGRFDV